MPRKKSTQPASGASGTGKSKPAAKPKPKKQPRAKTLLEVFANETIEVIEPQSELVESVHEAPRCRECSGPLGQTDDGRDICNGCHSRNTEAMKARLRQLEPQPVHHPPEPSWPPYVPKYVESLEDLNPDTLVATPGDYGGPYPLGDDSWSREFIKTMMETPQAKTVKMYLEQARDVKMESTPYWEWLMHELRSNGSVWGFLHTELDCRIQYEKFLQMIEHGLTGKPWPGVDSEYVFLDPKNSQYYGAFPVTIHNNGSISLLQDGVHRMSIQLVIGRPSWVTIVDRETSWHESKKRLLEMEGGTLYQPLLHPDFAGYPVSRSDVYEYNIFKFLTCGPEPISANFRTGFTMYDLGCCYGFTLAKFREFERRTKKAFVRWGIGVEQNLTRSWFAEKVLVREALAFERADVVEWLNKGQYGVDVVIALALIHQVTRLQPQNVDAFLEKLGSVVGKYLFLTIPNRDSSEYDWLTPEMQGAPIDYIREKTGLSKIYSIAMPGSPRPLYVMERV